MQHWIQKMSGTFPVFRLHWCLISNSILSSHTPTPRLSQPDSALSNNRIYNTAVIKSPDLADEMPESGVDVSSFLRGRGQ
jgi:hypothetical protein